MTMPAFPQVGYPRDGHPEDPPWTTWAQAVHDAATEVMEGRLTEAAQRAAFGRLVGPSNGTGDAAAINAALDAASTTGRGIVKGTPGETYVVDATITLRSNTTLDLSGCALVRKAGFTGLMLSNAAASPLRTVADAAITAATATLTSATAAFTSADVGRAVTIVGAGLPYAGAAQDLYAKIASVTNGTTVVLSVNAPATVSGATLRVYGRDQRIGVIGDAATLIDAGNTGGQDYINRFRRVDGLTIIGRGGTCRGHNGGGVVFWSVGDIDGFTWDGWTFTPTPGQATPGPGGIQPCGPMNNFSITNVRGTTYDDVIALQGSARGWDTPTYQVNDVQGDITNGFIGQVYPVDCRSAGVKMFGGLTNAGIDTVIRGVTVDTVRGNTQLEGFILSPDRAGPTTLDDVTIRNVSISVGDATKAPVSIHLSPSSGILRLRDIAWPGGSGTSGAPRNLIFLGGQGKKTDIAGISAITGDYVDLVYVAGNSAVLNTVTIDNGYVAAGTTGTNIVVLGNDAGAPAQVTNLELSRLRQNGTGKALINNGTVTTLVMPRAVEPLLPTAIDGLTAWYRADAITGLANGAAVASWADSSPAGNALTQATGANQPTYVASAQNGLPGVQFDGSNDVLAAAAGIKVGHVFVVAKYSAATFSGYAGLVSSTGGSDTAILVGHSGSAVMEASFPGVINSAAYLRDGDPYTDTTLPGPMNQYGLLEIAAQVSSFTNPMTLALGQDRGLAGRYWNGVILEVVVFRKALTLNARQAIETYLAGKWGTQTIVTL